MGRNKFKPITSEDVDKNQVSFRYLGDGRWESIVAFRLGKNLVKVKFDEKTNHASFNPSVEQI